MKPVYIRGEENDPKVLFDFSWLVFMLFSRMVTDYQSLIVKPT